MTSIDIEQRRLAERDERIVRHHTGGMRFQEIASLMGVEPNFVKAVILRHHRGQVSRNGSVYAQMVEAQGQVVWAEPAPLNETDALQIAELQKALRIARSTGQRVMLCVAVLPPDDEIEIKGAA